MSYLSRFASASVASALLCACGGDTPPAAEPPKPPAVPTPAPARVATPRRELRAAWVATVANIDWPSKPGLDSGTQQREALAILDRLVALQMNAVILQVRPAADALYASQIEPWSFYLSGQQGRPPEPVYDPLQFWIDAAHTRGLQLHAWFNPYRVSHPSDDRGPCAQSIAHTHPHLVYQLATPGYRWMDPSRRAVQDRCVAVLLDVVSRYDVDGVHLDDYFYPYRAYHGGKDFPDDASYRAYAAGGGTLSRHDWRRAAVDGLIERLYREIKACKRHVEFGISPFGIWRPNHPRGVAGLDQYDVLFADARKWWNEGWVDYLMPQLYWPIGKVEQSFPVLLGWWQSENTHHRHLWPGTSMRSARPPAGARELVEQVMVTRGMTPDSPGICVFSMKGLLPADSQVAQALRRGPYAEPALIPASPWLDAQPPEVPEVRVVPNGSERLLAWRPRGTEPAFWFVVYTRRPGAGWSLRIVPGQIRQVQLASDVDAVAVTAVDRCRLESTQHVVELAPSLRRR
ncbi:MAG: family 10 glycosylhydrolase [Planctomycetes bacterium]|nr:family 10 glycosylhydrolase [Planctomycetota bacterium]